MNITNTTIVSNGVKTLANGFACAYTNGVPWWVIFLAFCGLFAIFNLIPKLVLPSIYMGVYFYGFIIWIKQLINKIRKNKK